MKYKKQLLIIIIVVGIISFFLWISMVGGEPSEGETERLKALKFIPNNLTGAGWMCYIWLWILVGALVGVLFCFLLSPLLLFFHKKILGRKMQYGIEKQPTPEKFNRTFKSFFPALLAINLAFMLAEVGIIQDIVLTDYIGQNSSFERELFTFLCLVPLMMAIAMALFSSTWLLQNSGIVYTNKDKVKDIDQPTQVGNSGGFYMRLLKGYAGIGVIVVLVSNMMILGSYEDDPSQNWLFISILLLGILPFLMILLALPAMVLFDMMQKIRENYIQKWAKIFGIRDLVEINFQKINKS